MTIAKRVKLFKLLVIASAVSSLLIVYTKVQIIYGPPTVEEYEQADNKILEIKFNNEDKSDNDEHQDIIEEDKFEQATEEMTEEVPVPFDDAMPGAYLKLIEPAKPNQHYCKYNYGLPYDLNYTFEDLRFPPQKGNSSSYNVIYNVTEAYDSHSYPQVTYATHITANFAYFILEHLRYWDGLISVAAFVPEQDVALFLEQISQFCYCQPEMRRVSIHLVTHKNVPFSKKGVYFEQPPDCRPRDASKLEIYSQSDETVIYPINVLRNVARTSALTKYVVLSDVELMPSQDLAKSFLEMIKRHNKTDAKEVFVLPIFEIENTESVPENKEELLKLLNQKKAVYFHEMICKHCQKFPGIETWYKSGFSDNIKPLLSTKRQEPYHRWEPLFIGTNAEPLYEEDLSWEGLQDKMSQSLEMCLQDYNYTILDNAFLCHWPGIRRKKLLTEDWRADFVAKNKEEFTKIIKRLSENYADISGCRVNFTGAKLPEKRKN